jgi:hypothetical protein
LPASSHLRSESAAGAFLFLCQSYSRGQVEHILLVISGVAVDFGEDLSQALPRPGRQRLLPCTLLWFFCVIGGQIRLARGGELVPKGGHLEGETAGMMKTKEDDILLDQ